MKRLKDLYREKKTASWLWMLVAACFLAASLPAAAGVLIWPTNVYIDSREKGNAMWLENRGDAVQTYQLQIYKWTQANGKDELKDQNAIVASPPIMQIEPGKKQLVRLIRTEAVPAGKEQTYRVIFDEIPSATPEAKDETNGVKFRMRYSIPIFVFGEGLSRQSMQPGDEKTEADKAITGKNLSWRIASGKKQKTLEIHNSGPVHVHLRNLTFARTGETWTDPGGPAGYILPGATMSWPLKASMGSGQTLLAIINGKQLIRINAANANEAD